MESERERGFSIAFRVTRNRIANPRLRSGKMEIRAQIVFELDPVRVATEQPLIGFYLDIPINLKGKLEFRQPLFE